MLYFGHRFPKGEKLSPSPSEAHLSGACLEYAERSDSSIEVLYHHVPTILPSPSLTGWTAFVWGCGQCRCSAPRHPCRCLITFGVRLGCGGETGTAHMKQWRFSISSVGYDCTGANPIHNPSLENKKAVNETPVEKHISLWLTRYPSRGRDFINGSNCIGFHT